MSRESLTLCPLGFLELAPPDLISLASNAGFDAVCIRSRAAVPGGPEYPMRTGDALFRETRGRIDATGVTIESVEQVGLTAALDVASLQPMLEAASALGATRIVCSGDDPDFGIVARRFAQLCDLAASNGMSVDLEFMVFRAVKTLEDALRIAEAADRPNGFVVIDALHLFRSGGSVDNVRRAPTRWLSGIQLCDAPAVPPAFDQLPTEARHNRLPLGLGGLPVADLLGCLPGSTLLSVEIPLHGDLARGSAADRARLLNESTRRFLQAHGRASW